MDNRPDTDINGSVLEAPILGSVAVKSRSIYVWFVLV